MASTVSTSRATRSLPVAPDLFAALAATLAFAAFHALRGFPSLADSNGDNDSLLRLVQVRDLIAGQGWFDPTQYRMGLEGGFPMHWSRLVDLPIALLVATLGETAARVVWPLLLLGVSLFLVIRTARLLAGPDAFLPAVVTGLLSLHFVNVFRPGAIDHHNAQLALVLLAAYALAAAWRTGASAPARGGAVGGLAAALMLAIGMEAAPYVAVACAITAAAYLGGTDQGNRIARGFGLSFAAAGVAAFLATIPARQWLAVQCDALSLPQGSLAVLGGAGLALIATVPMLNRSLPVRLAASAALAAIVAGLAVTAFPQCLGDPFVDLDPVLRRYWLSAVSEAQSVAALWRAADYGTLVGYYATPLLALGVMAVRFARGRLAPEALVVGAFLAAAVMVSFWQVRGGVFSVPLASIVLATWIAGARVRAQADRRAGPQLAMVGCWLVSINLVWVAAVLALLPGDDAAAETAAGPAASACYRLSDYDGLAALPPGTVLTVSNLGSSILHQTPHRVLNGPYHRNNAGNRAALDMLMGSEDEAQGAMRAHGIDYVLVCPGNSETDALVGWAPDGFLARLLRQPPPAWLEEVGAGDDHPLRVYRLAGS